MTVFNEFTCYKDKNKAIYFAVPFIFRIFYFIFIFYFFLKRRLPLQYTTIGTEAKKNVGKMNFMVHNLDEQ